MKVVISNVMFNSNSGSIDSNDLTQIMTYGSVLKLVAYDKQAAQLKCAEPGLDLQEKE